MRCSIACREALPAWAAARDWECPDASPIMGPAPACWLNWVPERASAACEPGPSVLSMAAEWGVSPIQWLAASQAEATRAGPATVAASHAGLGRRVDEIKEGFLCLVTGLVRLGTVLVRVDEDRDGLRCRADARDKAGPSLGRRDCARLPPGCWPEPVLPPVACGRRAGQGDGEHPGGWPSRTLGGAGPPGCLTNRRREGETRKTGSGPEVLAGRSHRPGGPPYQASPQLGAQVRSARARRGMGSSR